MKELSSHPGSDSFKVALISEEYPPFAFGGIASACNDLAHALSQKGISTTVFCGRSSRILTERVNDNLQIIRLPCFDLPPRFVWFQLQNLQVLSRSLREYSLLHIVNPQAGAIITYLNRTLRKPIVTSIHGLRLATLKLSMNIPFSLRTPWDIGDYLIGYPLDALLHDICLRHSNHVTVCSHSALAELRSLYTDLNPEKVSVIHNGIDFKEICNYPKVDENSSSIIFYGRLNYLKGVTYLIRAIASLQSNFPDLHLKIFGDGPLRRKIERLVSKLGLSKKVTIAGFVARQELVTEIAKASIVVLPSLHEAQPVGLLEGMACRKPVVAFDFPFSREVIQDMQNGLLAKGCDVKDLSEKIRMLLADKKLRQRLGQNAYAHVRKTHDWTTLVNQYISVYLSMVAYHE